MKLRPDFLYVLFLLLFLPLIVGKCLFHRSFRHNFFNKLLATLRLRAQATQQVDVLFYFASIGEAKIVEKLIRQWQRTGHPFRYGFLAGNLSGLSYCQTNMQRDQDFAQLAPFDFFFAVQRLYKLLTPRAVVVLESEYWPNFLTLFGQKGSLCFLNARMSSSTFLGLWWLRFFYKQPLQQVKKYYSSKKNCLHNLQRFGILPHQLSLTNSVKYCLLAPTPQKILAAEYAQIFDKQLITEKKPFIFVASSLQVAEISYLLKAWLAIQAQLQQAYCVLILRHPNDAAAADKQIRQQLRAFAAQHAELQPNFDALTVAKEGGHAHYPKNIVLICRFGAAVMWYQLADCVFVGGSWVKRGGQNFLEPLAFQKCTAVGPYCPNFQEEVDCFLAAKGLLQLQNPDDLQRFVLSCYKQEKTAQQFAYNGYQTLVKNQFCWEHLAQELLQDLAL